MARIQLKANAAEGEQGNFPPIPEGEYVLACADVKDRTTKTGRAMATLELIVADGPYEGRKLWHNVTMIPAGEAGHGLLVQALKAFGLAFDGQLDFDTQDFKGQGCRAKVVVKTYEGKQSNEIPAGGFVTGEPQQNEAPAAAPAQAAKQQRQTVPF